MRELSGFFEYLLSFYNGMFQVVRGRSFVLCVLAFLKRFEQVYLNKDVWLVL